MSLTQNNDTKYSPERHEYYIQCYLVTKRILFYKLIKHKKNAAHLFEIDYSV